MSKSIIEVILAELLNGVARLSVPMDVAHLLDIALHHGDIVDRPSLLQFFRLLSFGLHLGLHENALSFRIVASVTGNEVVGTLVLLGDLVLSLHSDSLANADDLVTRRI